MSNLTTAGAAHRTNFTGGERREVVVQHERLCRLARCIDCVETLNVVSSTERYRDEGLRLAARKQRRAVRTRQYLCVDRYWPNFLRTSTVNAFAGIEHLRAKRIVFHFLEKG